MSSEYIGDNLSSAEQYDHPQEECGVFGVYAPGGPVIQLTIAALGELQHRGQSGAGIAYVDSNSFTPEGVPAPQLVVHKDEGLVPEALSPLYPSGRGQSGFSLARFEQQMASPLAIGHVRYSTAEGEGHSGAHPHLGHENGIALAHNGELYNMREVAEGFLVSVEDVAQKLGVSPEFVTDSALLTATIDSVTTWFKANRPHDPDPLIAALHKVLPHVDGAYTLTITDRSRLIAVRDPWAIRPLALGQLPNDEGYMVASESVIFDSLGAEFVRDFEQGEIMVIDENGVRSESIDRDEPTMHCAFEYFYTAREDGTLDGASIYAARKNFGKSIAENNQFDVDAVVGVPESGMAGAFGFSEASGLPIVKAISLNRYSGRTFIERADTGRQQKIDSKYRINAVEVAGKRIVLFDDSVIKGNTMQALVQRLKEAGATAVHVVSSAPRYEYACHMGMDTHNLDLLIAKGLSDEAIANEIGADSITFNEPEKIEQAVKDAIESDRLRQKFGSLCMACMTGEYPFSLRKRPIPVQLGMPAVRQLVGTAAYGS